ncbi:MAG TPA: YIP1 family protein [Bryobacteraceae bacterium]|nr:YIP1 family protein [Bryobacteraceae bacterium]
MSPQDIEERPMSEAGRIMNVYLEPKAAFADIAARPRPWVPLVLLIVFSVAYLSVFSSRVGWGRVMEQQMERNPQIQNMSAEQRAKAQEGIAKASSVMGYVVPVSPIVTIPLFTLVVAGVFVVVFRVMMGADLTFKQLFAITAYAWLPDLIYQAAATAVVLLKNPDEFNMENPLAFNVGAYLDPQATSKAVMSIASSIDLFSFWKIGLLAVGIAVAARKISFTTALIGVTIPWAVWVVAKTGLAVLRG